MGSVSTIMGCPGELELRSQTLNHFTSQTFNDNLYYSVLTPERTCIQTAHPMTRQNNFKRRSLAIGEANISLSGSFPSIIRAVAQRMLIKMIQHGYKLY